jgi:hypothetical protein
MISARGVILVTTLTLGAFPELTGLSLGDPVEHPTSNRQSIAAIMYLKRNMGPPY